MSSASGPHHTQSALAQYENSAYGPNPWYRLYHQHIVAASRIIMVIIDQICLMIQLLALVMKLSSIICRLSMLENCRLQLLLDRLGRCLKLFASIGDPSSHEFASQFGRATFYMRTNIHTLAETVSPALVFI